MYSNKKIWARLRDLDQSIIVFSSCSENKKLGLCTSLTHIGKFVYIYWRIMYIKRKAYFEFERYYNLSLFFINIVTWEAV